jgi:hypothetical protein
MVSHCTKFLGSFSYIMYSGEAAEALADNYKLEKVENSYFFTQKRYDDMKKAQEDILIQFFFFFFFDILYNKKLHIQFLKRPRKTNLLGLLDVLH